MKKNPGEYLPAPGGGEKVMVDIAVILKYLLFSVNSVQIEQKYPFQSAHTLRNRKNCHFIVKEVLISNLLSILMDCVRQK